MTWTSQATRIATRALIVGIFLFAAASSYAQPTRECAPYDPPTQDKLLIWATDAAAIQKFASAHITVAPNPAGANLAWDIPAKTVANAQGLEVANDVADACDFSAIISHWRAVSVFKEMAGPQPLRVLTLPTG